jgi:hypothetical protein
MRVLLIIIAVLLIAFSAWWYFQDISEQVAVALGYAPPVTTRGGEMQSAGAMMWLPRALDIFNTVVGVLGLVIGIVGLRR